MFAIENNATLKLALLTHTVGKTFQFAPILLIIPQVTQFLKEKTLVVNLGP